MWEDDAGVRHQIRQAEGGEQGDPLMPLLFSLGIHDSLSTVRSRMRRQDSLFAYLDDVHVVSPPDRTREAYNILQEQLLVGAGIRLHIGKTRAWNRGGTQPADLEELGEEVWSPSGIKILGTPLGSPEFVRSVVERRLEDEGKLWQAVTWVPDLQCGWQILLQCAGPRCHHILRTLPPSESAEYAQRHDDGMWQAMQALMGGLTGTEEQKLTARQLTTLPMRMGGLWFEMRTAHGSCSVLVFVGRCASHGPRETSTSGTKRRGRVGRRPGCGRMHWGIARNFSWTLLKLGARPPPADFSEPGEWAHGWQYFASSVTEYHYRKTTMLRQSCPSHQAHLRSHSGGGCSDVLHGCPTSAEFVVEPELIRTLVLERLKVATCRGGCRL